MLSFYYVDEAYADYLRQIDNHIPYFNYDTNKKFVCGIVLTVNDLAYYAPISHNTIKNQTSFVIYDGYRAISSIRFSFMFPVLKPNLLNRLDFNEIAKEDPRYAALLRAEYRYCSAHKSQILKKATTVYRIGCNTNHRMNHLCCNFKSLEDAARIYVIS